MVSHSKEQALPKDAPVSFTFLAAVKSDLMLDAYACPHPGAKSEPNCFSRRA